MNAEEVLISLAKELHSEYEGYNLSGALQDLEDRIIRAEVSAVAHPHPAIRVGSPADSEAAPVAGELPSRPEEEPRWIINWTERAACKDTNPNELFVQGAAQNRAKLICRGCPVRTECLADALDNGIEFGVWGGMTERERRALLRRRPDVTSWVDLLKEARHRYEQKLSVEDLGLRQIS
jgi:WhiB family transcriptional regulator, redox-sensing transcriptional regulator